MGIRFLLWIKGTIKMGTGVSGLPFLNFDKLFSEGNEDYLEKNKVVLFSQFSKEEI